MDDDKTKNLTPSPQMSAKQGIHKYGEMAITVIVKEFKQMVNGAYRGKPVIAAINNSELTDQDKKAALDAINMIKVKKNGTIKGRTCANGSRARLFEER